jgi:hypothetical protein
MLDLTRSVVTEADVWGTGYVTVWPTGEPLPTASSLNFAAGATVPNLVITKVGTNGTVSLFNSDGDTHFVVDLLGWFDVSGRGPSGYASSPKRLMDTRDALVKIGADSIMQLKVTDVAGVPSRAKAVVLNVTVVDPTETSFLTVYPLGQPLPTVSNLNFTPGSTVPNQVIATIGDGGKSVSTTTRAKPTSSPTSSAGRPNGRDRQRRRAGSV